MAKLNLVHSLYMKKKIIIKLNLQVCLIGVGAIQKLDWTPLA